MRDRIHPPRSRTSIAATSLAFVIGLLATGDAKAQSAEAESLFNEGNKLMTDRQTAKACDAFEASNRVESRAGTLIRLGECREQLQQLASAWSAYKDALSRVKDPRKRDIAAAKVAALEPRLSYLTISVPATSQTDGLALTRNGKPVDPLLWNRALPIDGGDYAFVASAPGHKDWQATVHVDAEHARASVDVPALEAVPAAVTAPVAAHQVVPVAEPGAFTARRKLAVATAGVSVAALVVGGILGVTARSKQDDAHALCPDPRVSCDEPERANALIRSGHDRAIGADVAFGIGAAAAITTAVLWWTGGPERSHGVAFVPAVSPASQQVVLTAQGSF